MSYWQIYLLTRLDYVQGLLFFTALCFGAAIPLMCIIYDDGDEKIWRIAIIKKLVVGLILSSVGAIMVPSNKDIAIIFASHWATNSVNAEKIPDNVLKTMNKFMDKYLQDGTHE